MRRQGLSFATVALVMALAACGAPEPDPSPSVASPTSTPTPEPAMYGQSVLPLDCADLIDTKALASLSSGIVVRVDETKLAPRLNEIGLVQTGTLRCVWGDNEYGGTGAYGGVTLEIAPTEATSFDLAAEAENYYHEPSLVDDSPPTLVASCYGDSYQSYCTTVQLRDGYRVALSVSGRGDTTEKVTAFTAALLDSVGAVIDQAGPARETAIPPTTGDPVGVCQDPALAPVLAARGAVGAPEVREDSFRGSPVVTTCIWVTSLPSADFQESVFVSVLPGGAWAIPAIVAGPRIYPIDYEPTGDGSRLVGCGDGCGAIVALGGDLVMLGDSHVDTDPAEWAALVAQIG